MLVTNECVGLSIEAVQPTVIGPDPEVFFVIFVNERDTVF